MSWIDGAITLFQVGPEPMICRPRKSSHMLVEDLTLVLGLDQSNGPLRGTFLAQAPPQLPNVQVHPSQMLQPGLRGVARLTPTFTFPGEAKTCRRHVFRRGIIPGGARNYLMLVSLHEYGVGEVFRCLGPLSLTWLPRIPYGDSTGPCHCYAYSKCILNIL